MKVITDHIRAPRQQVSMWKLLLGLCYHRKQRTLSQWRNNRTPPVTAHISTGSTAAALEPGELFAAGGNTNGTAALEDSSASPAKLDLLLLYIWCHATWYKQSLKIHFYPATNIRLFIAALCIIAHQTSCLSVGEWLIVHPDSRILFRTKRKWATKS